MGQHDSRMGLVLASGVLCCGSLNFRKATDRWESALVLLVLGLAHGLGASIATGTDTKASGAVVGGNRELELGRVDVGLVLGGEQLDGTIP